MLVRIWNYRNSFITRGIQNGTTTLKDNLSLACYSSIRNKLKDITFFLGRPVWKVTFRVYYLLTEREPAVKGGDRGKILYSSQNFLLKITLVHSKCWRMTTLKHFGELLNLFS